MKTSNAAKQLGRLGGKATLKKYGKKYFSTIQRKKPDDQVTKRALYMRAYRERKMKKWSGE